MNIDVVSLGIGVIFTVVFIALVALSFTLDEVHEYFREQRKLKQKLIQRLERKNDDINN